MMALIRASNIEKRSAGNFYLEIQVSKEICGVYRLWYGKHFYIGSSIDVAKRASQHMCKINLFLRRKNFTKGGSYGTILRILWKDLGIECARMEVLQRCTPEELLISEQKWLNEYSSNRKCINFFIIATRQPLKVKS